MILFDFKCTQCDHTFEELVKSSVMEIPCPECGETAKRALLTPPRVDWMSMAQGANAPVGAVDYFERVHKQQKAIEERNEREHGDYGPRPGAD